MVVLLTIIFGFIPINFVKIFLLNTIGHKISYKSKIGFSFLAIKRIELDKHSKIKHFNFIKINSLKLNEASFIGSLNTIKGPFNVVLDNKAGIAKQNKIRRAYSPITYANAKLHLGQNSFIVSNHFLDLTKSIYIGNNSIIAGIGSQFWTHGYYHSDTGEERIRIDGGIKIENNVYVGSSCIFNPGVKVANSIHIGGGSVISKNLDKPGMYVGQGLRYIDNNLEKIKARLDKIEDPNLVEQVYTKQ